HRAGRGPARARAERDLHAWRRAGWTVLHRDAADYPPSLAAIAAPPPVLFVEGRLPDTLQREAGRADAVAVVGTRAASPWALAFAGRLAERLAAAGLTVVSGLALGVDAAAHHGALAADPALDAAFDPARTVAVLGSGLDRVHPRQHLRLARRIVVDGALISEQPPGTDAYPGSFPRRNRIIAGLARGVVIIEAPRRSGVEHTLTFALEQGRDVWVVPQRPDSEVGRAAYRRIRDGAAPLADAGDVLDAYRPDRTRRTPGAVADVASRASSAGGSDGSEASASPSLAEALLDRLRRDGDNDLDALLPDGVPPARALAVLARLERGGLVRRAAGGRFAAVPESPR
ncbi:MAG: DNA-processing protein DprA, partial [Trueperaceae bacterium]